MLLKGDLPKVEPIISVGLVLPEDKQNSIIITNSKSKKTISFKVNGDYISVNNKIIKENYFLDNNDGQNFNLDRIPVGRGFHWSREISVDITGDLLVKNVNGYLFIINRIKLEKYLACVATSEMSSRCPIALLEAQTIAARSWVLAADEQKHSNLNIDACNDDCCQRYQGINNLTNLAYKATSNTRGYVLTHQNKICDTRYSKSCGGISEANENVWFDKPKPYLRSISDNIEEKIPELNSEQQLLNWFNKPNTCFCDTREMSPNKLKSYLGNVDLKGSYFRWEYSINQDKLCKLINIKLDGSFEKINSLEAIDRGSSGRIIKLKINGTVLREPFHKIIKSEYEIRRTLHPKFLYSSAFIIIPHINSKSSPTHFTFKGAGWGHGVGLCQIGALNMALENYSSNKILFHYFQNTKLKKIYD